MKRQGTVINRKGDPNPNFFYIQDDEDPTKIYSAHLGDISSNENFLYSHTPIEHNKSCTKCNDRIDVLEINDKVQFEVFDELRPNQKRAIKIEKL